MHNYPTPYKHYNEPGLNGLFGWLRRQVNKLVNALRNFMPTAVYQVLDDFTNGDGQFNPFDVFNAGGGVQRFDNHTDLPLTPLDEANLDNWVDNNFIPYFTNVFQTLEGFKTNTPTAEEFIVFYNEANMLIGFLVAQSKYDTQNGVYGLTADAVTARNQFLDIQIQTLRETLNDFLNSQNLEVFTRRIDVEVVSSKYGALGFTSPQTMTVRYAEIAMLNGSTVDYTQVDQTNTPINTVSEGDDNTLRNLVIAVVSGVIISKVVK